MSTRVRIRFDEWWPVYEYEEVRIGEDTDPRDIIEVPADTLRRWNDIEDRFLGMQGDLADLHEQLHGFRP